MRTHVKRKRYRVHVLEMVLVGKVNEPGGIWVNGPGPATNSSYANGWSGAAHEKRGK